MIDEIRITSLSGRGTLLLKRGEYWSYWLGEADWGQVEGTHNTYAFWNQAGESIASTTIGPRPLTITGWVLGAGEPLQSRCDFLNTFISPVEDYQLAYNGKRIGFRPDSSVIYSPAYRQNNELARRFLIQGTCPFPLWRDAADTEVPFEDNGRLLRFPCGFGLREPLVFGVTGRAYSVEADNRGGFAAGVTLRLRFSGEVTNPRVRNLTSGGMVGVRRTFSRGEQLEIATTPGSKRMVLRRADGTEKDLIKLRDLGTDWFRLLPGRNRIALDCDDLDQRANMDVSLYFTPLYLEVE